MFQDQLKKGSAEILLLTLLSTRSCHGYELAKLIEARSEGVLHFYPASLYPTLYKMEQSGWIKGRWVEKPGQRRRRYYQITSAGKSILDDQRAAWRGFVSAMDKVLGVSHA
jgi:transcriptional regulator